VLCRNMEPLLVKDMIAEACKGYDVCNKLVNYVDISNESDLWHSRFCHASFGCLMRLVNLNLIPKFNLVKKSKCHVCVESKTTPQAPQGC
jgi:hypothetical protein